jgi:hypothetical protein
MATLLQRTATQTTSSAPRRDARQMLEVAARAQLSGAVLQPHPADHTVDPFSRVADFSLECETLRVVKFEPAPADNSEYW